MHRIYPVPNLHPSSPPSHSPSRSVPAESPATSRLQISGIRQASPWLRRLRHAARSRWPKDDPRWPRTNGEGFLRGFGMDLDSWVMRLLSPTFRPCFVDFKLKQSSYGTYRHARNCLGQLFGNPPKGLALFGSLAFLWSTNGSKMGTLKFDQIFHLRCYTPFPDTPKWLRWCPSLPVELCGAKVKCWPEKCIVAYPPGSKHG